MRNSNTFSSRVLRLRHPYKPTAAASEPYDGCSSAVARRCQELAVTGFRGFCLVAGPATIQRLRICVSLGKRRSRAVPLPCCPDDWAFVERKWVVVGSAARRAPQGPASRSCRLVADSIADRRSTSPLEGCAGAMRRPVTVLATIRIQLGCSPGAQESSLSWSSLWISSGCVTTSVTPLMMTLHPVRVRESIPSSSNQARAPCESANSFAPSPVRNATDCDALSNRYLTGLIIGVGSEFVVNMTRPKSLLSSSSRHCARVSSTSL